MRSHATKDLDILIGADAENSKAVYAALAKFGAPIEGLSAKDFAEPDNFFRMGTPPVIVRFQLSSIPTKSRGAATSCLR